MVTVVCRGWMMRCVTLLALSLFVGLVVSQQEASTLLRGVSLEDESSYLKDGAVFKCFANPSVVIPFDRVNDNYCDCPDSSDEPGTNACPSSMFFCANKFHVSSVIKSWKVNDGVCDCCDTSDEYLNPSLCKNTCYEDGAEERHRRERIEAARAQGLSRKTEYIATAAAAKESAANDLAEAQASADALKAKLADLEDKKSLAEKLEKLANIRLTRLKKEKEAAEAKTAAAAATGDTDDPLPPPIPGAPPSHTPEDEAAREWRKKMGFESAEEETTADELWEDIVEQDSDPIRRARLDRMRNKAKERKTRRQKIEDELAEIEEEERLERKASRGSWRARGRGSGRGRRDRDRRREDDAAPRDDRQFEKDDGAGNLNGDGDGDGGGDGHASGDGGSGVAPTKADEPQLSAEEKFELEGGAEGLELVPLGTEEAAVKGTDQNGKKDGTEYLNDYEGEWVEVEEGEGMGEGEVEDEVEDEQQEGDDNGEYGDDDEEGGGEEFSIVEGEPGELDWLYGSSSPPRGVVKRSDGVRRSGMSSTSDGGMAPRMKFSTRVVVESLEELEAKGLNEEQIEEIRNGRLLSSEVFERLRRELEPEPWWYELLMTPYRAFFPRTTEAEELRKAVRETKAALADADKKVDKLKKLDGIDFGPEAAFRALVDKCTSIEVREYTYEVCFFDKVTQTETDGRKSTSIGKWGKWTEPYTKFIFENGQACHGGPKRSLEVSLECGVEEKILSVAEPSKCEYVAVMTTPAACMPASS